MKITLLAVLVALISTSAFAKTTHVDTDVDNVATERPNAISAELLGRGLLYSINYDRSINENIAVGAGFSYWSLSSYTSKASVLVVPLYGNYYFSPDSNRGFITAGMDIVSVSVEDHGFYSSDNYFAGHASGVAAVVGGGYEYRGKGGFLFRGAPYLLAGSGGAAVWLGLTFGTTF